MRYHDLPGDQVFIRATPRKRRRSGPLALFAGLALVALAASPAGRAINPSSEIATASIPKIVVVAETPEHRTTLGARNVTLSELVFGAPTATAPSYSAVLGEPILSAALIAPAAAASASEPVQVAVAMPAPLPQPVASEVRQDAVPLPPPNPFRQAAQRTIVARSAAPAPVAQGAGVRDSEPGFLQRLFGAPAEPPSKEPTAMLAYAPVHNEHDTSLPNLSPFRRAPPVEKTAFYVINQGKVYMPDGSQLEAHSGIREKRDDPRYVHMRMKGATPPNTYILRMRERRFHGVEAIRMLPTEPGRMHGRDGILAHSYLLGPNGDSHGCVAFRDYAKFLNAFKRGEVTRMVVVADASSMLAMNGAR